VGLDCPISFYCLHTCVSDRSDRPARCLDHTLDRDTVDRAIRSLSKREEWFTRRRLRLELEWIDGDGPAAARRTDETLDAYTELLRQQVAQLRLEYMELPFHPRYQSLMAAGDPFAAGAVDGASEVHRLDLAIEELTFGAERLSDEQVGLREVRALIREFRRVRGRPGRRR